MFSLGAGGKRSSSGRTGGFDGFGGTQGVRTSGWCVDNILNRVDETSAIDCARFDDDPTSLCVVVSRCR
jgi:hypothetical protein